MTFSGARPHRIAAILAGGKSRRMGDIDKATFEVGGQRLIDLVKAGVRPQADEIVLSAKTDYGTGLEFISDQADRLAGPVAGLWAVANWAALHRPAAKGFFTVPVDAPLISHDLFDRLEEMGLSAIAQTKSGLHPTFGYWQIEPLLEALRDVPIGKTLSLRALSESIGAQRIQFKEEEGFSNINCPQDAENFKEKIKTL